MIPPKKGSSIEAARKYKEKLQKSKTPLLEVRKGDMVVNQYGLTMLVIRTTTEAETLKEVVEYIEQSHPQEGKKTITYDKLRRMCKVGKYVIYKGSAWKK